VILGDPCFQSDWVDCVYGRRLDIFNRTIELLNAMNAHDDVHYLQLLGDNFYDQEGSATHAWFQTLSLQSKSKLFGTVPGNHDYWINSSPEWYTQRDQLGNGFMQYYGIDTLAAGAGDAADADPFDFSQDPDDKQPDDPDRGTCRLWVYVRLSLPLCIHVSCIHVYKQVCQFACDNHVIPVFRSH
jgi:hypothetical protein